MVTRSYLFEVTDGYLRTQEFHVRQYRRVHPARVLEFGGGRHFLTPLLLSNAGAVEIFVYDIQRLSSPQQVNHTIRQLRGRIPGDWVEIADWSDLEREYRIHYVAPGDARNTGLPAGHIGLVCSTSTLEHIPAEDIRSILVESSRVAAPTAVFSHVIDYADHYCYSDAAISPVNFYRYSARRWRWFNPSNHFQNRLRHSDFERLFRESKLSPIEIRAGAYSGDPLGAIKVDREFRHYDSADLRTSIGYFALSKDGSHGQLGERRSFEGA